MKPERCCNFDLTGDTELGRFGAVLDTSFVISARGGSGQGSGNHHVHKQLKKVQQQ
jgi:hypothetical protein